METLTSNFVITIKAKDALIEQLQRDNEALVKEVERLKNENTDLKRTSIELNNEQNSSLIKRLPHDNDDVNNHIYSEFCDDDDESYAERRRSKRRRGRPKRLIDITLADQRRNVINKESRPRGRPRKYPRPDGGGGDTIVAKSNVKTDDTPIDNESKDVNENENHINKLPIEKPKRKHPHHCDWPGCDRSFRRPAFLRKHKRVHTGEKPFKCDFDNCDYKTGDIFCLRTHQLRHTGEKPFKCKVSGCGWSGRQQTSLDRHKRVFHAGARPYVCDWPGCERRYRDKHSLNYHSKSHTGEKEFMCSYPECGKRFIGRSDMKKHETTHTNNKPHKCSWPGCGRSFVQKRALNVHNLKHTGERPYACDWPGCEWRSYTPHESAKHKKTHTGERPFPCDRCERRFADESNLKAHQRVVHDGEKRHICDYLGCGKKYTVRRTLLIHQMRAHMINN